MSRWLTEAADRAGPIENGVKEAGSELGCNPYLCRGYQYEDNTATEYKPGQVIDFHVDLIAGHRPGYAASGSIELSTPDACPILTQIPVQERVDS